MPFNPASPIRGYQTLEMLSPSRIDPRDVRDVPPAGGTLRGTDAASRVTSQSNYTSNTGGRARQNWCTSISTAVGSLRRSNTTATSNPARLGPISGPIRRASAGTTNDSPTDPALIPSNAIELPASPFVDGPITMPDEPHSFLDFDSDSSSEDDRDYSRLIVSRANSFRVQRPKLVQNNSGTHSSLAGSGLTIEVYNGDLILPRPLQKTTSRPMSTHNEEEQQLQTPVTETTDEGTRGMGPQHAYKALTATAPSPQFISRFSATTINSPSSAGGDMVSETIERPTEVDTTTGLGLEAGLRALTDVDKNVSTTVLPTTPRSKEAEKDNRNSGFFVTASKETIIEVPNSMTVQSTLPSPLGGFGSVTSIAAIRAKQSLPSPLNSNPVNVVGIHPTTLVTSPLHQNSNRKITIRPSDLVIADAHGYHQLFRDRIVSTPYPKRGGSLANPEEALAKKKGPVSLSDENDRFPSPNRTEVLVLQIAIAHHTGMKKTISIEIADKGTFDDEQLFKNVQMAYSSDLLGLAGRIFSARKLSDAGFENDRSFDAESFIKHLREPRFGHRRKEWLLWLRRHQPVALDSPQDRFHDSPSSYHSPLSIPRTPFQRSLPQPPKVVLHFEFSILAIGWAVLVCFLLSCLATLLWVFCGIPGFDASNDRLLERNWHRGAESRVLTGLVLGLLVLSLSSLGGALWIGGSYVLL